MKKHQMHALVAVAEHGSIRRAAQSLSLSQTALTKALRELELDMQASLLQRNPQGVSLTPVGAELLAHAKLILAQMDEARAAVRHRQGLGSPPVKVAVTPTFSLVCLTETVSRFRQRFPHAPLSIRDAFLSQTLPMLRDGTIDLAIAAVLPGAQGSDLAFENLGELEIALAGRLPASASRSRSKHPVPQSYDLADLAHAAPWLLDSSRGGISEAVRRWLASHSVGALGQAMECTSSMASLVLSSEGAAIVPTPRPILSVPWLAGVSKEIVVRQPLPSLPLGLVTRKGHRLDASADWFAECARLEIQRMLA
ncbi:LysR family transcriptional regulator [Cupriavidus basilensis]